MNHLTRRTTLALAALLLSGGPAWASSTSFKLKGGEVSALFTLRQSKACGTSTAVVETTVSVRGVETSTRVKGAVTTTLQTILSVQRFDPCTADFSLDFGTFTNGTLQMNALNSGVVAGHFVLDSGRVVDLQLTVTGSTTTQTGISLRREHLGNTITILHEVGSSRTGTLAGTVTIDGTSFGTAQFLDVDASLARHTTGELTILKP